MKTPKDKCLNEFYTVEQIAELKPCTTQAVRKAIKENRITEAVQRGKIWLIHKSGAKEFLCQ